MRVFCLLAARACSYVCGMRVIVCLWRLWARTLAVRARLYAACGMRALVCSWRARARTFFGRVLVFLWRVRAVCVYDVCVVMSAWICWACVCMYTGNMWGARLPSAFVWYVYDLINVQNVNRNLSWPLANICGYSKLINIPPKRLQNSQPAWLTESNTVLTASNLNHSSILPSVCPFSARPVCFLKHAFINLFSYVSVNPLSWPFV